MISDPAESWFVKDHALQVIGSASADQVAPHVDVILPYLQHQEWWLQNAGMGSVWNGAGIRRLAASRSAGVPPVLGRESALTQRHSGQWLFSIPNS